MGTRKEYLLVGRTRASAVFKQNEHFRLTYKHADNEPAKMAFMTRYRDEGFEHPIPEDLWVEVRCFAENISQAVDVYFAGARDVANVVGFSANAFIGSLDVELAYEVAAGLAEREFFQSFVRETPLTVVPGRLIKPELARAITKALEGHESRDRIVRAIAQYQHALEHWTLGSEVLAVAHLFMAAETLKTAALQKYIADSGMDESKVAQAWGYKPGGGYMQMPQFLQSEARRRLVFHDDGPTHKDAKWVSDHFEHGIENVGAFRPLAVKAIVATGNHLRRTIIETLGLPDDVQQALMGKAYARPRGPLKLVKYMFGTLKGDGEQLAQDGQMYPIFTWKTGINKLSVDDDGATGFQMKEEFTPKFGPGIAFTPLRFEGWDGGLLSEIGAAKTADEMPKDYLKLE